MREQPNPIREFIVHKKSAAMKRERWGLKFRGENLGVRF
jgi:hypothetical protein